MNPILKKILIHLLTAALGSGVTIAVTEGISINCKPVVSVGGSNEA